MGVSCSEIIIIKGPSFNMFGVSKWTYSLGRPREQTRIKTVEEKK